MLSAAFASAQQPPPKPETPECSFAVYSGKQVDKKVRILAKPEPRYDSNDLRKSPPGTIVLRAVFCGSGQVTDIKLQSGLADGLNEKAIEAARRIRFIPAEKDGHKVSQLLIVNYFVKS